MKTRTSSTERLDRRYLLIRTDSEADVEQAILRFAGTLGLAKAALLRVNNLDKDEKGTVIVTINRTSLESVQAACELAPKPIQIIRVSGTLKGLKD